jgi:Mg-chelatase subunit ChlI
MKLIKMNEVQAEPVRWLWYPYIPCGKITLVQGDPGDGKTTFVLAVAALLTNGKPMPECETTEPITPQTVIYQTAEDGLADTI